MKRFESFDFSGRIDPERGADGDPAGFTVGIPEGLDELPGELEGCLRLLDEVWPPGGRPGDEVPAELGRFRILGELGRGGFGVVFLAEDAMLGRRVALKVPRAEVLTGSEGWRRFLREARAASRLDHPNLVPLLEAGAAGPVGYIVSTYVPGPSLDRWLAGRAGPVAPRWAAALVSTLALAIEHAHGRNILHRDLKPANILLDAPGYSIDPTDASTWGEVPEEKWVPRICDFGLAKLHEIEEDETRSRLVCGSPPYMAPEQAESRRDEIGPPTDVYGLGAILYELIAGRPPFGGPGQLETLRRVVADEPTAPRALRRAIPRDLETICLKCLEKRPGRRYASAAALADDLGRFLDGRPVAARPARPPERAARWARRNPSAAAMIAAAALGALAAIGGAVWHEAALRALNEELRREATRAERHAQEAERHRRAAEDQSALVRRQLAGSQLFQAHQAVAGGRFERARRLLAATSPEFGPEGRTTSFPWAFLSGSVRDRIEVLVGHAGAVDALAISPDGRRLASGDDRGQVRAWNLIDGRCEAIFEASGGVVDRLAWSADGRRLAWTDRGSGEVRIGEVGSGRILGRLAGTGSGEPIWALEFEADGRRIRAIGPRRAPVSATARAWDLSGPGPEFREVEAPPEAPSDRAASIAGVLDGERPVGASGSLAFTRDGVFGVIDRGDGLVEVFRGGSSTRLALVCIRPDRSTVVLLSPKVDRGASTPAERRRLHRMAASIVRGRQAGKSMSKARVLEGWSGADGPVAGEVVAWNEVSKRLALIDLEDGSERRVSELGPLNGVQAIALGPDGTSLALGTEDHRVLIWRRRPRPRTIATAGHALAEAWAVAFSADGRTVYSGGDDHLVRIWDASNGRELGRFEGQGSLVTSLAVSPDGGMLAAGSFDLGRPVVIWDPRTGRPGPRLPAPRRRVRHVAFSPDGRTLAASAEEDTLLLWSTSDGKSVATIELKRHSGGAAIAFHPDGRTLAVSGVRPGLVDVATRAFRPIPVDEQGGPVAFSPDGRQLVAGFRDGTIRAWDVATLGPIRSVQAHAGLVLGLALAPDGTTLASAGEEGTVRLWDIATGQELMGLSDGKARVNAVAFSRDGRSLAAADHSGAVTIWDARPHR